MTALPTDITGPVTVIGDVHGQIAALESLLVQLERRRDFRVRWLVFIGDLIDRGPDPLGVIETVLTLREELPKLTAVCGNHDFAAAAAMELIPTPAASNWRDRYTRSYDAGTTFASYGVRDVDALREAMPAAHRDFIAGLPWAVFHPDYLFVHAGLLPDRPFNEQVRDLRHPDSGLNAPAWLCDRQIAFTPVPADCPLTVVSGHVEVQEVEFTDRRILVDTTGGFGGKLSAVLLPEREVMTSGPEPMRKKGKTKW